MTIRSRAPETGRTTPSLKEPRDPPWRAAASGFILGVLLWIGAWELGIRGIPFFRSWHLFLMAGSFGGVLALTRARFLLWIAGAAVCLMLFTVGYTPLASIAVRSWMRSDVLQPAEAVVALSAEVYPNGTPNEHGQLRLVHAYELLSTGYAQRLVLTRIAPPSPSAVPMVTRQMRRLRLNYPIDEVGSTNDTHDEALAVARLAHRRGWKRVILVSDAVHLRRAAAVFARAGVPVICSPSTSGAYDPRALDSPGDRLAAFRDWFHEVVGYAIYRRRGWI